MVTNDPHSPYWMRRKTSKLKKYSQIEAENFLNYKNGSLQIQNVMCVFKLEEHKKPIQRYSLKIKTKIVTQKNMKRWKESIQ